MEHGEGETRGKLLCVVLLVFRPTLGRHPKVMKIFCFFWGAGGKASLLGVGVLGCSGCAVPR